MIMVTARQPHGMSRGSCRSHNSQITNCAQQPSSTSSHQGSTKRIHRCYSTSAEPLYHGAGVLTGIPVGEGSRIA